MRAIALLLFAVAGLADAAVVDVTVRNFRYVPNAITINAGDTVRWTNVEGVHNVAADDGAFRSAVSGSNWVYNQTFGEPGVVRYYCEVHSAPGLDIDNASARATRGNIYGVWRLGTGAGAAYQANVIHQRGGPPITGLSGDIATLAGRALHLYGS